MATEPHRNPHFNYINKLAKEPAINFNEISVGPDTAGPTTSLLLFQQ